MNDLLGGQVDLLCDQTTQTTPYIKAEIDRWTPVIRKAGVYAD